MSTDQIDPKACAAIREDLSEFALRLVSGRRRAEMLEHLQTCSKCSAQLEEDVLVADALLALAPEIDPPLGFESRLAKRLGERSVSLRRRRIRLAAMAAAAAVAVLFGFGIGVIATGHTSGGPASQSANLTEARLVSGGRAIGYVYLASGSPAWMFMSVGDANWSGTVWCEVTSTSGNVATVGRFDLIQGHGAWGVPLKDSSSHVRSASLVDAAGVTLATARLTS